MECLIQWMKIDPHKYISLWTFRTLETKTLNSSKKKIHTMYKKLRIRLSLDFSITTLEFGRKWKNSLSKFKEKTIQLRILYPAKLLVKCERRKRILWHARSQNITAHVSFLRKLREEMIHQNVGKKSRKRKAWNPGNWGCYPKESQRECPWWRRVTPGWQLSPKYKEQAA